MALTRARFVAGDASLGAALAKTVRKTLTGERGAAAIAQATRAMRGLIASYPWAMDRFMMMSDRRSRGW
jgi:glutamine synthetase adenylyltransferase